MHRLFTDNPLNLRHKIIGIYGVLIIYNIVVWLLAFYTFHDYPLLFSMAVLSYTFGLRHAVDADHIAAIDNVTRKLMQEGKQPAAAGLFFSLGHSSVVMIATVFIALATSSLMHAHWDQWHEIGSIVCISISSLFLLLIAIINLFIFFSIYEIFQKVRKDKHANDIDIDNLMNNRSFLSRRFRPLFQIISHSWQMFPLGFLFGIGFDTATEITVLGIAASETLNGISIWSILLFPALFTAGMTLIDTTDCIIMLGAYGWAFMKPIRKLYYNLTITFVSIIIALVVGGIEVLGLIATKIESEGMIWNMIKSLNNHYSTLGYMIILLFIASWVLSVIIYKYMQFDKLESLP